MATARPPRDVTPKEFFETWLPAEFARTYGAARYAGADIRVRVELEGEGGGAWDLSVVEGRLAVEAPACAEPTVTVRQSVVDWRAVTAGEEGAIDLAPPQASPLDILFVDPAARQVLASVRGTLRFEVGGYHGRTWMLTVTFGGAPRPTPDATIAVDAETYAQMLARKLAPPEAFFAGKIRLTGDTGLAMQLGMAMLPRFAS